MVKSYNFGSPTKYYDLRLRDFKGVDLSSYPSEVSPQRSPEAVNIFSSKNGIAEKRTGFKQEFVINHSALVPNGANKDIKGFWEFKLEQPSLYRIGASDYGTETLLLDVQFCNLGNYLYYRFKDTEQPYWDDFFNSWEHVLYKDTSGSSLDNVVRTDDDRPLNIVPLSTIKKDFSIYGINVKLNTYRALFFGGGIDGVISFQREESIAPFVLFAEDTHQQIEPAKTFIACDATGGGEAYEDVSLLTPQRKVGYKTVSASMKLPEAKISAVTSVGFHGTTVELGAVTLEYRKTDGTWGKLSEGAITVNRTTGTVTLSVPADLAVVTGEDNAYITYSYAVGKFIKPVTWNTAKKKFVTMLSDISVYGHYGLNNNSNYLFVAKDNIDRYVALDTLYASDLAYSIVGSEQSDIIGYSIVSNKMVIHKTQYQNEPTMYLRSSGLDDKGNIIFPITPGVSNVSAVAKDTFVMFRDENMFLSDDGVYAVVTDNVTDIQSLQSRSYYIDRKLAQEPNKADAKAISHGGYWYLFFPNGHVYVADNRKKSYEKDAKTESYQYDWYYWEGITAKTLFISDNKLYFTKGNKVYRFKDQSEPNAYADVNDAGALVPVQAYWTTPILYMGDITYKKSLKNLWARLATYDRSGVDIYYRLKGEQKLVKSTDIDLFDFADIDFTRFSFNTDTSPHVVVTNRMERQFMSIQFMFKNERSEPFGLLEVIARYKINSEYKGG